MASLGQNHNGKEPSRTGRPWGRGHGLSGMMLGGGAVMSQSNLLNLEERLTLHVPEAVE